MAVGLAIIRYLASVLMADLHSHLYTCTVRYGRAWGGSCRMDGGAYRVRVVQVTAQDLQDSYLPAFKAGVTTGNARGVMCSYNQLNGAPSSPSSASSSSSSLSSSSPAPSSSSLSWSYSCQQLLQL